MKLTSYTASPTRRTKAGMAAIRDAILAVIKDDPPMTVRQVFYQLVTRKVIEKSEEQYRLMTDMRLHASARSNGRRAARSFGLVRTVRTLPRPRPPVRPPFRRQSQHRAA
jgi:hypothetical protein